MKIPGRVLHLLALSKLRDTFPEVHRFLIGTSATTYARSSQPRTVTGVSERVLFA